MTRAQHITCFLLGVLFVVAGALHFVAPAFYEQIMPPYVPWSRILVYASGAAEVAGGVGLLMPPPVRRWAGAGVVALLLAVFPANIHMAHEAIVLYGWAAPWTWATLLRLPLQFVLVGVVWWSARAHRQEGSPT